MAATSFEPGIKWKTLESEHFRVDYPEELETLGRRVLAFAEDSHQKVATYMKVTPYEKTEIVCFDTFDDTNANASNYPHNRILLNLHAPTPDDGFPIGRYDDWIRYVILHEYTHILHANETPWAIAQLNAILGKVFLSNLPITGVPGYVTEYIPTLLSESPRFITEGWAVTTESKFTPGGRAKEGDLDMKLRMATLEHKLYSIDQVNGSYLQDWPSGGNEYDYGTAFFQYLTATYGEDKPGLILDKFGKLPWLGFDFAVSQVLPGKSCNSLWDETMGWMHQRFANQAKEIKKHPLTESTRLTSTGRHHHHPRWLADGTLSFTESYKGKGSSLVKMDPAVPGRITPLLQKDPTSDHSLSPDGRYVYYSAQGGERFSTFSDLHRFDLVSRQAKQLTEKARAVEPALSPDGKTLVAVATAEGANCLVLLDPDGKQQRRLTKPSPNYTFANPVWAPDGKHLVVSRWSSGRYNLVEVDLSTGKQTELTTGHALDFYPSFSQDGNYLSFTSDRSGVFNLYALRLSDRKLLQLTNVLGGAFDGRISPDGKQIAFVNYSSVGYDIHIMPFNPSSARSVDMGDMLTSDLEGHYGPRPLEHATPVDMSYALAATPRAYNPWPSIAPNSYSPLIARDTSGLVLGVSAFGQDVLRQHTVNTLAGMGLGSGRPFYGVYYQNDELLPSLSVMYMRTPGAAAYQTLQPDSTHLEVQTLLQDQHFFDAAVRFPGIPFPLLGGDWITGDSFQVGFRSFYNDTYALNQKLYVASQAGAEMTSETTTPIPDQSKLVKSELNADPGLTDSVYAMWQRADNYKRSYGISPEGGSLATVGVQKASSVLGGTGEFDRIWGDYRQYVSLPMPHHVLALRGVSGMNWGQHGGQFRLGGNEAPRFFNQIDLTAASSLFDSSLPFRGFDTAGVGNKFAMLSAEYRFPIFEVRKGLWTLPFYMDNLYGVLGYDAGNVWDSPVFREQFRPYQYKWTMHGVSAELRSQVHLFRFLKTDLRLGISQGLNTPDNSQLSLNYAVPATRLIFGFGTMF